MNIQILDDYYTQMFMGGRFDYYIHSQIFNYAQMFL